MKVNFPMKSLRKLNESEEDEIDEESKNCHQIMKGA